MKNRLTKFFTVFLAVVLCIGMAPATGSTAYAASRWGGSSISSWWNSLFGGSNSNSNNNSSSNSNQAGENDATGQGSNQLTTNSADETGTANDIQLTKKAIANGTKDGKPKFNIQLGVKGKEVKKGAPVDFTLVVDLSASMTNNGSQSLAITKDAARAFINTVLADGNTNVRVSIVAYGTMGHAYNFDKGTWDLYGSTKTDGYYTSDRQTALNVINSSDFAPKGLSPTSGRNYTDYESGGTNTEAGFLTAQAVTATRKSNAMSKVVFMTDGVPTYHYRNDNTVTGGGSSTTAEDFNEAVAAGKALKAAGNDIYTVGLLTSYDEGSSDLEMANKLLSDQHSYSYGSSSSVSYNEITNKKNSTYYDNKNNLWIKDGEDYVQVQVDREWNWYQYTYTYTYTYTKNGQRQTKSSSGDKEDPKLTLYAQKTTTGAGYTENGAAYSDKYYPITDASTAASEINKIYTTIAKESLVLATGDIVDYIPDGFTVDEDSVKAAGGSVIKDSTGKITAVKFTGVPAGKEVATKTFTVVYTGNKYGVAYTNTEATYSGTLYDASTFSKPFPLPVVGLNPATTDDEYYLDPNTDSNLAILDNDTLNQIAEDGYSISDLQVTLSDVPSGVTANVQKVNDKYVVVFNGPAGDYEFNYVITATATKGTNSKGLPAEGQDGWNDGKTQFTITSRVTNVKVHIVAAANKAFVVDFDKPVTYSANQVFDTNELKANITLPKTSGTYGNMSLNDNKSITYTLTKFMDGIDKFIFNENYGGKKDVSKSVSMIPATSVYYDDSFGSTEEGNGGIVYSSDWKAITNEQANKELQDAAQGLDANYGYDSSYDDFIGNSNGTVHKVTADANGNVTATVKFTGTGIDVYALTNQTGGKVYAKLYSSDGKLKKSLLRDYSYLTGELFHVPVISFNGFAKDTYTLQLTIMKGSTFYLDGVRIYNPLGTDIDQLPAEAKEAYKADGELGSQLAYIRDGILKNSTIITDVQGTVYIDKYKSSTSSTGYVDGHNVTLGEDGVLAEYTRYGCKTETYLPAGKSLTLTLDQDYSNIQLGLKSSVNGATYTINNGATRNINSSTDMYYKVTAKDKKITITNTSDAMIEITALKVVK